MHVSLFSISIKECYAFVRARERKRTAFCFCFEHHHCDAEIQKLLSRTNAGGKHEQSDRNNMLTLRSNCVEHKQNNATFEFRSLSLSLCVFFHLLISIENGNRFYLCMCSCSCVCVVDCHGIVEHDAYGLNAVCVRCAYRSFHFVRSISRLANELRPYQISRSFHSFHCMQHSFEIRGYPRD